MNSMKATTILKGLVRRFAKAVRPQDPPAKTKRSDKPISGQKGTEKPQKPPDGLDPDNKFESRVRNPISVVLACRRASCNAEKTEFVCPSEATETGHNRHKCAHACRYVFTALAMRWHCWTFHLSLT